MARSSLPAQGEAAGPDSKAPFPLSPQPLSSTSHLCSSSHIGGFKVVQLLSLPVTSCVASGLNWEVLFSVVSLSHVLFLLLAPGPIGAEFCC